MKSVHERVLVADEPACREGGNGFGVVHACKSPCHQRAVGYKGNLPKSHPNYFWLRKQMDLYLNMIDPPVALFPDELFQVFLPFAREVWDSGNTLLIHCNQGESRAPSLAMIFLAKYVGSLPNESFEVARSEFAKIFPDYAPGAGIEKYLTSNWEKLNAF